MNMQVPCGDRGMMGRGFVGHLGFYFCCNETRNPETKDDDRNLFQSPRVAVWGFRPPN